MQTTRIVKRLVVTIGIASAVVTALTTGAWAQLDVNGTWSGKAVCKGFFEGQPFSDTFVDPGLQITRSGDDLHVLAFGVVYKGKIIDDADIVKKAQGSMIACGTVAEPFPSYGEIAHLKFTLSGTTLKFTAKSVFTIGGPPPDVATCTWTFKRTDATDPGLGGCVS
jgi:hypothetical protein